MGIVHCNLLTRDLMLTYRCKSALLSQLLMAISVVVIFPLSLNATAKVYSTMLVPILWLALLFASTITSNQQLEEDRQNGSLAELLLSQRSWTMLVLQKALAHWLSTTLPCVLTLPLLALMFDYPVELLALLFVTLLLGSLPIAVISLLLASVMLGNKAHLGLLLLLGLPLYLPIIIIGSSISVAALADLPIAGALAILLALAIFWFVICVLSLRFTLRENAV